MCVYACVCVKERKRDRGNEDEEKRQEFYEDLIIISRK